MRAITAAHIVTIASVMTSNGSQPGSDGDGMPILSKGTIVQYIFYSNDMQFVMIKAPDGTTGWIPSYDAIFHDGQPF